MDATSHTVVRLKINYSVTLRELASLKQKQHHTIVNDTHHFPPYGFYFVRIFIGTSGITNPYMLGENRQILQFPQLWHLFNNIIIVVISKKKGENMANNYYCCTNKK